MWIKPQACCGSSVKGFLYLLYQIAGAGGSGKTKPSAASLRNRTATIIAPMLHSTSPRTATSAPGDTAGRCTTLAVAFVSVTASVPPATTVAPRRTRRSPPHVLFLECAGSCSYACPLRVLASSPTIDAGQRPAPRPGISVATSLRRMSARPTIQASHHAPANLRRSNVRALQKHNPPLTPPALSSSPGPFRGPALRQSCSRRPFYGPFSRRPD